MANKCRSVVALFGCHRPKVKAGQRPRKLLTTKFQSEPVVFGRGRSSKDVEDVEDVLYT